jgi:hypothetical protein
MQTNNSKSATFLKSVLAASVLLLGGGAALAQQVKLTAAASNAAMPDGTAVPMWGYTCGAAPIGGSSATCSALNRAVAAAQAAVAAGAATTAQAALAQSWSPVIITVPSGQDLTINLTNSLPTGVPTSLVIVGQVGGGLGSARTTVQSPAHAAQGVTWPIVGAPDTSGQVGGDPTSAGNLTFTPPPQPNRVQSFSTEVATGQTTALTWTAPRPGTYLIESGTHPSIQAPMGLIGMVVVTCAPGDTTGCTAGTAYPSVAYDADLAILLSEVDPLQNAAVNIAVGTGGFLETNAFAGYTATGGQTWHCKNNTGAIVADNACYPPAVNYTPTYYLINGRGFDRTNSSAFLYPINPSTVTSGNLLVRLVNAGLRMHVPSIVGATSLGTTGAPGMALIAEDGNPLPGKARIQSEVFMAAGKTYDVMINVPTGAMALPIFDRQLSLSANTTARDAGMLAYIGAKGATAPVVGSQAAATAKDDAYSLLIGQTLTVSDPSRGVIANDTNVTGVTLLTAPNFGTLTLNTNGTFTYIPNDPSVITADSFQYCANGSVTAGTPTNTCSSGLTAKVTLGGSTVAGSGVDCGAGAGTAATATFNASIASQITVKPPGILAGCTDGAGLALTIKGATASAPLTVGGGAATVSVDGGFTAASGSATQTFNVTVQNGKGETANVAVTVNYPTGSNLQVTVLDGTDHKTQISDYRWVIEEDRTFFVDPKCTTNPLPAGCPVAIQSGPAAGAPVNYGTNFHTSYMPLVAAGCTGPLSCEGGQTMQGANVVCDVGNGVCRPGAAQNLTLPGQVPLDPTKRYYISVLPGDAANPFVGGNQSASANCAPAPGVQQGYNADGSLNTNCGHGMGGAPIPAGAISVTVMTVQTPLPTATMSVFVFEDDWPLNGEQGAGGAVDVLATNEPGLGGFQVTIFDQAGGTGDATGQPTYDMFNQPLSNSLAGTLDPITGLDACPISNSVTNNIRAQISANLTRTSRTFTYTLPPGTTSLPPALAVGATLSDGAPAGAIPAGTTIANITQVGTTTSYTVTMSAAATARATADKILVFNGTQQGIVGMIVTCPKFESDGKTLSPMVGQAIIKNLYPGRYGVTALPGSDRIALGEEWIQTNTLDGQKAHDSFMRVGEPGYFQEFGPAGYHVSIGFANPKIINDRRTNTGKTGMCDSGASGGQLACNWEIKGSVYGSRLSRTPDQRLYSSGSRDALSFTQCYVSLGDPDGAEIAFTKCDADGSFDFQGIPAGNWKLTTFDQWNDQIIDGITQGVGVGCQPAAPGVVSSGPCDPTATVAGTTGCNGGGTAGTVCDMGEIGVHQWQANMYTRTFIDNEGTGVSADSKPGLALVATNVRFRDGSYSNFNNTDLNGFAGFNEVFPLFNWYVIETDSTRYKTTGVHVIYDAGGPADGSASCDPSAAPCGNSQTAAFFANTYEKFPLPAELMPPGSVPCANADCTSESIASGFKLPAAVFNSTGRIDPPYWFGSYGWQGYIGQGNFLEFGKKPFAAGETGPIHGHVIYASTRPFDDPQLLTQLSWEPMIPHVRVNLYQEGVAADGVTPTLTLVDHTETTSFDDWAQGFRKDANGNPVHAADGKSYLPNISCPGQTANAAGTMFDPFYYALQDQPSYLDLYNKQHPATGPYNPSATGTPLPYDSQYKCYDGMHSWNQLQPAPYDGMYSFPSVTSLDPVTGKPAGTNCTACLTNPDSTDPYRYGGSTTPTTFVPGTSPGVPMLPPGKYVVEVVVPPGYELVKEEDKNILIGDNYIAPATVQFPGLGGSVFILPDQASLSATYNSTNAQNATVNLGRTTSLVSHEGDTGSDESFWPCVGTVRQVPDFISLYPQSGEVSPFAGAMRPLCDRKEVNLTEQSSALVKFYLFTSTHVAAHFQGIILDDFTAEFDPFSPQFGEKFAPSYLPIGIKDWTGNEVNRVYSDQFGLYNGLNYSTWEVNPPNPTGYGPTMMVYCMNDAGMTNGVNGQSTPDSLFQPGYSQFCYELPSMPGQTGYFDTPVVPVQAFSEGYNHPDCAYPDATPAIGSVTSADAAGPWVSAPGHTVTVNSLGNQSVEWYGYTGPAITKAPYNQPKSTRNYGFGSAKGTVQVGNVTVNPANVTWSDRSISFPAPSGVSACAVQQQNKYGGSTATCGELVITTAAGKQSVDAVTVTIGGKKPTVLTAGQTIQSAIDAASPGDMIIVPPGTYNEMVVMWKPVRLQGVGAASSVIDANTQPAGKLLTPWRQKIVCVFGLTVDGRPRSTTDSACDSGMNFALIGDTTRNFATMTVDRLPFEATLGWDASLNGNLAEQLSEPSLLGAYEGAAITVVAKGVKFPRGTAINDAFGATTGAAFPANTVLLTASDCGGSNANTANPYPTNYFCNPSSIDGLGIRDSSQGGGGIFVHAYAHNLQIANNRVHNNTGTMSGGITIGAGEHPDVELAGTATVLSYPESCETSNVTNLALPFCFNMHVNIHNNAVVGNSSMGDELFSSTPAGAGGVSINTGADYYTFTNNWVCGNISTGDGGGFSHIGLSKKGNIEHNAIIFNQSTNPTITTNGGGVLVMGAPDADPTTCGTTTDQDCLPPPGTISPSDGTGQGLVINANLILGNAADSGSGGGLRMQAVNGTDVLNFPNGATACTADLGAGTGRSSHCYWNSANVTNNIIVNNVAGWDGAGVSLLDSLAVNIVNNTIAANDSTASSGTLFQSLFAPLASSTPVSKTTCGATGGQSCPQVSGLVSVNNSPVLVANINQTAGTKSCPQGHGASSAACFGSNAQPGHSIPLMFNDAIWQNRSFYIGVGGFGPASSGQNQQHLVSLYNAAQEAGNQQATTTGSGTTSGNQTATGACPAGSTYWEIGFRGDTQAGSHGAQGFAPSNSVLSSSIYGGTGNQTTSPAFTSQYCNGSRTPPEAGGTGWQVPPGTNETNAFPNPVFSLTPAAVVDEGNNWVNLRWGPLSLYPIDGANSPSYQGATPLADYTPKTGSSAINAGAASVTVGTNGSAVTVSAPKTDFFGNTRPAGGYDIGAVQHQAAAIATPVLNSITPSSGAPGTSVNVTLTGANLTGATAVNVSGSGITVSKLTVVSSTSVTVTLTIAGAATPGAGTVTVTTPGGTSGSVTFTVSAPAPTLTAISPAPNSSPNPYVHGTSVPVTLTGTGLTGGTVSVAGSGGPTVTVINQVVVNSSTVTATLVIPPQNGVIGRVETVTVTTPGGKSNGLSFTVN